MTAARHPARTRTTYGDYPDDPQLRQIDAYHEQIHAARTKKRRTHAGQVYTPWPVVRFMVDSVLEQWEDKRGAGNWAAFFAYDPFCGAGIFPLAMARALSARTGWPLPDVVARRIGGADLDLGALLTARRVLRSLPDCAEAEPRLYWCDTLADFPWLVASECGADQIDTLDIDLIDRLNDGFAARAAAWKGTEFAGAWAADSARAGKVRPLGVVDLRDLSRVRLRLAPLPDDNAAARMPPELREAIQEPW